MTREIVSKTVRAKARTEKKKDDTRATSRSRGGFPCRAVRSSSKIQASLRTGFFPTFGGVFRRAVQSRFSPPRSVRRGSRAARRGGAGPSFLAVPIKRAGTAAFVGRGICAWGGGHRSCPPPCTTETRPLGEQTFPLLCFYTSSPSPPPPLDGQVFCWSPVYGNASRRADEPDRGRRGVLFEWARFFVTCDPIPICWCSRSGAIGHATLTRTAAGNRPLDPQD